jgi:hypothetical protein
LWYLSSNFFPTISSCSFCFSLIFLCLVYSLSGFRLFIWERPILLYLLVKSLPHSHSMSHFPNITCLPV